MAALVSSAPRRLIVVGAGAIGAPVGVSIAEQGVEVVLVARGEHGRVLAERGLDLRLPSGPRLLRARCAARLLDAQPSPEDLVVLSVMSHDSRAALAECPPDVPVVSLQNGTSCLEVIASRGHPLLAGVVYIPAERRGPGVVAWHGSPHPGAVLLGPWANSFPSSWATWLVERLRGIGLVADVRTDIDALVRGKLLGNLAGIAVALCDEPSTAVLDALRREAEQVWTAAGLRFVSPEALLALAGRPDAVLVDGIAREGGSTRHALRRGQPLETAALHGPIIELGRTTGVPTPVNSALVHLAERASRQGWRAGAMSAAELDVAVANGGSGHVDP